MYIIDILFLFKEYIKIWIKWMRKREREIVFDNKDMNKIVYF